MPYIKYFCLIIIPSGILMGILFSSCEKNDPTVIDPVLHFPVIDSASITPTTFDTNIVHISTCAHVTSVDPVQKVTAEVKNPLDSSILTVTMNNNGNGVYTGSIDFVMDCRLVGAYKVNFLAVTNANLYSVSIPVNFSVINSHNHPPVITNLIIFPKDFTIHVQSSLVFLVNASDADGSCDIKNVHYFGKYPNGYSPLTEHGLYDDGSCCPVEGFGPSGDTTANDGKYTRFFPYAAPDSLGYYHYNIIAIDRTGDTSNVLSDSIYVHN